MSRKVFVYVRIAVETADDALLVAPLIAREVTHWAARADVQAGSQPANEVTKLEGPGYTLTLNASWNVERQDAAPEAGQCAGATVQVH